MTIQDNRAKWFSDTAPLRAADEGAWLCRFILGRQVQGRIQPADLTLERLLAKGRKAAAVDIETARAKRRGQR